MSIRNCGELGINLQKIVSRLMSNDKLVKLLYYQHKDPIGANALSEKEKQEKIYEKLIKITPRMVEDDTNNCVVVVYVVAGRKDKSNSEFKTVRIAVDIFVPLEMWVIKDSNLRPFAILGEIQNSLEGKKVNGLGEISGGDFELTNLTDKISVYSQTFSIVEYD